MTRRAALLGAAALAGGATAEQVRESAFNYIIIDVRDQVVSFRRVESGARLSSIDLRRPERQVVPYTGYLFLPALLRPRPAAVLSIGLGAGAFNRLFNLAFPDARLVSVEIDPMILAVAEEFTGFRTGPNNRVEIADGRRFLRRNRQLWSWIVLDAYVRRSQIPPHLTTLEFYRLLRDRLEPEGVLAVNLVGSPGLVRRVGATLEAAMPGAVFWNVRGSANVVALASPRPGLRDRLAAATPPALAVDPAEYGADLATMAGERTYGVPADPALVLTDDYAPTEFLNQE